MLQLKRPQLTQSSGRLVSRHFRVLEVLLEKAYLVDRGKQTVPISAFEGVVPLLRLTVHELELLGVQLLDVVLNSGFSGPFGQLYLPLAEVLNRSRRIRLHTIENSVQFIHFDVFP